MTTRRIDQLIQHPRSVAQPLKIYNGLVPVRDGSLGSDNTKHIPMDAYGVGTCIANVQNFGANPHAVGDSTAAFQAAIDHVATDWGKGSVWMPPGTYNVNQIALHLGVSIIGSGRDSSAIRQPDGLNTSCIVQDAPTLADGYIHSTILRDFSLVKSGGDNTTDTVGDGILIDSNAGEGFKISNVHVFGFPDSGIHIRGAITCWLQDLSFWTNGIYGLYLECGGGHSWAGHYVLGVSGDNNGWSGGPALIGIAGANVWACGIKSEQNAAQDYAVQIQGDSTGNWVILNNITHTGNNGAIPPAIVHIVNTGVGATVWIQGHHTHGGEPTNLIKDDFLGQNLVNGGNQQTCIVWSSQAGGVIHSVSSYGGSWGRAMEDPPAIAGHNNFAIGKTNGVGVGSSGNITALAKGAATNAPASLVVNKWVYATLNGVTGWIPFFT